MAKSFLAIVMSLCMFSVGVMAEVEERGKSKSLITAAGQERLSNDEIRAILIDKCVIPKVWRDPSVISNNDKPFLTFVERYEGDGGYYLYGLSRLVKRQFVIADNQLCIESEGQPICLDVWRVQKGDISLSIAKVNNVPHWGVEIYADAKDCSNALSEQGGKFPPPLSLLNSQEVEKLVVGNSIYSSDDEAKNETRNPERFSAQGFWRDFDSEGGEQGKYTIHDGLLCVIPDIQQDAEQCRRFFRDKNGKIYTQKAYVSLLMASSPIQPVRITSQ